MSTKQVKIKDENGNVFTINAPADATTDEIQQWVNSNEGSRAVMTAKRDKDASNFAGGKLFYGGPKEDKREISSGQAFAGQAKHALNNLGANVSNFMDQFTPLGVARDAAGVLTGTPVEEQNKRTNQTLSEGRAFVEKTKEMGHKNYGGAAVETLYQGLGMLAPPLRATRAPYLTNSLAQAGVQASLAGAGAKEDNRLGESLSAGAGSILGDALIGAASRVAKPVWHLTKDAKLLADKGIYATPMSASGASLKAAEDKLMSIPGVGDILAAGRRAGVKDYNKYIITDTSGGPLPGAGYGREAFDAALDRFNTRYDDALNGLHLNINDPAIQSSFNNVVRNNELDKQGLDTFNQTWNNFRANHAQGSMPITGVNTPGLSVQNPFGPPTLIDGSGVQRLTQKFGERAKSFQQSKDPYHNQTGDAYSDAREELFNAVANQNIGNKGAAGVQKLKDTNLDYARFSPVMSAGNRAAATRRDGVFSPAEGLGALKQHMERRGNGNMFLRGQGDNQDVHQAANNVLGSSYPDSGTAGRLAVTSLALGGGGFGVDRMTESDVGYLPLAAIAAYVAASSSKGGRQYMLGRKYGWQDPLSQALQNATARKAASTLGATAAGDDPSFLNPNIYEPWGK